MIRSIYNIDGEEIGAVVLTENNKIEFRDMNEGLEFHLRATSIFDSTSQPKAFFKSLGLLNTSRCKVGHEQEE